MSETSFPLSGIRRMLLTVFMTTLIALSSVAVAPTSEVAAGWNGQQIQVNWCYATSITFSGYNQYGNYASKTFYTTSGTTKTTGWYWVGSVKIVSRGTFGTTAKYVNVPKVQLHSNWYNVTGCA